MGKHWYTESDSSATPAPTWEAVTGTGPDRLAEAAAAGPSIGKAGRGVIDHALTGVIVVSALAACCGAVPVAVLALVAWRIQVRRSRVRDRLAWELATPTRGARRYRTVEVAAPRGTDRKFPGHRWWAVLDESGTPVFGLFGAQTRLSTPRASCIVPGGHAWQGSLQPVPVAGFWTANCRFLGTPTEKGYTALHLVRADGRPELAVRLADPSQRDVVEVLRYGDGLGTDEAAAVLSCLALYRARLRPGSAVVDLGPTPHAAGGTGSPVGPPGPGGSVATPAEPVPAVLTGDAWPRGFVGTAAPVPDGVR